MSRPVAPRALILVRNAVSHDARVLREAKTLRGLGFEVLIAGVVSTTEPERSVVVEGFEVVRLAPGAGLRSRLPGAGLRARLRGPVSAAATPQTAAAPHPSMPSTAPAGFSLRAALRRLALTASYYLQGLALVRRASPTLVHANDYNTMWIAVAAKFLCASRVVYDCHELWADRNGRPEWRAWLVACEALFVRIADVTITASPGYARELARRYRIPEPTVVRNIPERDVVPVSDPRAQVARDEVLAVYVGGLMTGRGLEPAIQALALAPGVRLRLIGPGRADYRARLRSVAREQGVEDRVELVEPVVPAAVVRAIEGADVGLMLIEPVCRSYELTLPNKLFEYAAAGVPILSSDLPVIGSVVRSHGIGEAVPVDDVGAIARGLRRLGEPEANALLAERVREFAARETWARERDVLEQVYAPSEHDRVASTYSAYAGSVRRQRSWAAENPGNAAIRGEFVQRAFALAGAELGAAEGALLDVGCGSGWWLDELAAAPSVRLRLHGLDVLPERVEAARSRVPEAELTVGDARALPYDPQTFTVVTMLTFLSSLACNPDVARALGEARRVLAPGGLLLIWEPRVANPLNRSTLTIPAELLRRALPGATVQAVSLTVLPPLARRLGKATPGLYPWLARVPALRTHRLAAIRF